MTLRSDEVHAKISTNLRQLLTLAKNHDSHLNLLELVSSTKRLIQEFETLPKSLDPHLQFYVDSITTSYLTLKDSSLLNFSDNGLVDGVASLVLSLAKVRGYKFVATFFTTDVYIFTKVLRFLKPQGIVANSEECYFLLLWLSNLVLVPFNLDTVEDSLARDILQVSTKFMFLHTSASKMQIISSSILALLLTRVDCNGLLLNYTESVKSSWPEQTDIAKLGYLMVFNQLLKRGSSSDASKFAQEIYYDIILYELSRLILEESKFSTTNIKYLFKVASKSSRFFIQCAEWDTVAEIIDSLSFIMQLMKDLFDTSLRECLAKGLSRMVGYLTSPAVNYASQLVRYMLKQFKTDLPIEYTSELQLEIRADLIPLYHTVLLFSGFLAMTRSLQKEFVPIYLSIVHQTAYLSYRSCGLHQSSQLRDASCFCMWALLKNMTPEVFTNTYTSNPDAISDLFLDAIRIAIFDEDLTIRRCGVAVLQEFTGRFGSVFFKTLLLNENEDDIGSFTIKFIEFFGTSSIGSSSDSHKLVHDLVSLGFPKEIFLQQILLEIDQDLCPFRVKVDAGNQISRLLEAICNPISVKSPLLTKKQVIDFLISRLLDFNFGALYALSQLLRSGHLPLEQSKMVNTVVMNLSFDFHHDNSEKGEAMLHWLVAAFETKLAPGSAGVIPLVINISKLNCSDSLVNVLQKFFSLALDIPIGDYEEICRQIRLGNHLLARSVTAHNTSELELSQLLEIVLDKGVEAGQRAFIISGFLELLAKFQDHALLQVTLVNLLDDYSVSSQGDVGLLVRYACIQLFISYPSFASRIEATLFGKLLRIAGETLDKLRISAFICLCLLEGNMEFQAKYHLYNNDYKMYFQDLFKFFTTSSRCKVHAESFWNGLILTAGAAVAGSDLINISMRQMMTYLENENDERDFWIVVLRLLSLPSGKTLKTLDAREKKVIHATLSIIVKFFDAEFSFPSNLNYESLFIRSYNLHINTSHTGRISLVIRLFRHLSCNKQVPGAVATKAFDRLCWLAVSSSLERVRSEAMDAMYEIVIDFETSDELLDSFDKAGELSNQERKKLFDRVRSIVIT